MSLSQNFSSVPVLDYTLTKDPATRPKFLDQLRNTLIHIGFLYLSNPPISQHDTDLVVDYLPKLFALPQEKKDKLAMRNTPHFLGYNNIGSEFTKGKADQREQFDIGTPYENRWTPGSPDYLRLWGPSQWPDEQDIPGWKETFLRFIAQVGDLSDEFIDLVGESLGLKRDAFRVFFDPVMQHRVKVVKYPAAASDTASNQGVGPHFDPGFLSFLLQASPHHKVLQVQNLSGEWIEVPPIPGTLVINIGKGLEMVTYGLTRATSHRVLSPPAGSTPRYSVPFSQSIRQSARLNEIKLEFPPDILALREERNAAASQDSVNYGEYGHEPAGQVYLIGRVKSHPDVAERHYPHLFRKYFPDRVQAEGESSNGN